MTAAPDSMSSGLQHGLRITASEVVFFNKWSSELATLGRCARFIADWDWGTGGVNAGIKVRDFLARMDG